MRKNVSFGMVPFRGDGSRGAVAAPLLDFRLSNAQTSLSAAFGSGSIGGPLVACTRPSELKNRRVMRRFYTATARPRQIPYMGVIFFGNLLTGVAFGVIFDNEQMF